MYSFSFSFSHGFFEVQQTEKHKEHFHKAQGIAVTRQNSNWLLLAGEATNN
jgi:hypothetical protein